MRRSRSGSSSRPSIAVTLTSTGADPTAWSMRSSTTRVIRSSTSTAVSSVSILSLTSSRRPWPLLSWDKSVVALGACNLRVLWGAGARRGSGTSGRCGTKEGIIVISGRCGAEERSKEKRSFGSGPRGVRRTSRIVASRAAQLRLSCSALHVSSRTVRESHQQGHAWGRGTEWCCFSCLTVHA